MQLSDIWKHFKKICIHKFWVGYYCFKAGLYWQGITHDFSKFSLTEFIESVKYYQGNRSPIEACKEANGYSMAWLHHRGRNLHHYECWVDNFDQYGAGGELTLIEMPYKYVLELVCDYLGAGRAYSGTKFSYQAEWEWWVNTKRDKCAMAPHTKAFVDTCLYMMKELDREIVSDKDFLKLIYGCRELKMHPAD